MHRLANGAAGSSPHVGMDRSKDWQLEFLMDKIRSKSMHQKAFYDTAKAVRMALLDKRYVLDSIDKAQHQKCLDMLQHSIKVTSLQSMVERLESLTRQLGLKFVQAPSGVELFISSDMFYLEIVLNPSGLVCDVKVHHEGKIEQQSCEELVHCLSTNDFDDFTAQLEGFTSIYQLNAEKKVKARAFTALQSLEADLSALGQLQTFIKEPFNVVHKSPVGVLEKRRGGHAMKLTYFVSPYDLIDEAKCDVDPISIDVVVGRKLGYSVAVYMEGSVARKLQTAPLITVNRNHNGKGSPSYAPLTAQNSAMIPANFLLRLNKPMPMCAELIAQIHAITDLECVDASHTHPLLSLIATHTSNGALDAGNNRALFVTLPDQTHCYFMTENRSMHGAVVTSVPFTHPAHVAQILNVLRQQALFNTLIASCIRPHSRQDLERMVMLEVSALSWTHISISLEHPIEENMATAEIDLSDISNLTCRFFSPGVPPPAGSEIASELTTKVLNRSCSLPVTMRAVLCHWEKQIVVRHANHYNGLENFNLPLGSGDPGGRNSSSGNNSALGDREIKQEPSMMPSHPHQGIFLNETLLNASGFAGFAHDSTPVLTNVELTNILSGRDKPKRAKRKTGGGGGGGGDDLWKSTKRKPGDDELMDASSCDSTSRSTPLSQDTEIQTPNSALGFHSDLELSALDADFDPDDLGDVEEVLSGKKDKSPLSCDFDSNKLVSPSVSITPINTSQVTLSTPPTNLDRRSSIEIFPITTANTQLSSSVTITPISQKVDKDKKSAKRADDKTRMDKKKKRKREGSPMGPPERIPNKPDALPKPLGVSPPNSPSMARKFSPSPTHNRSLSGKLSPNLMKSAMKTHSPKHSPAHVPSSPKHMMATISSPKSSPKHPSTSGSGKPSMSALKNAASSPSSKSDIKKSSSSASKEAMREKEKKTGGGSYSSALKTSKSYIKVKALDLNSIVEGVPSSHLDVDAISPGLGIDLTKATSNLNQIRNRKSGCLSAIVDKLAKAQNCDITAELVSKPKERATTPGKSDVASALPKSSTSKQGQETKNSEYVLKHSSDCMKLTINKTRTREPCAKPIKSSSAGSGSVPVGLTSGSGSSSSSSTGSPKNHTGLKPGVNSGPASKKPQQPGGAAKPSLVYPCATYPPSSVKPFVKSSSSGSIKLQTSTSTNLNKKMVNVYGPKNIVDMNRKDRPKLSKSSSEKSIFSKAEKGKASPTQETENLNLNFPTKKQFDKSFQIPKLSARTADDKKTKTTTTTENNIANRDKLLDTLSKYPTPLPTSKLFDTTMEAKIRNTMNSVSITNNSLTISTTQSALHPASISPKGDAHTTSASEDSKKPKDETSFSKTLLPPISVGNAPSKQFLANKPDVLSQANRSIDLTSKFIASAPKLDEVKADKRPDTEVVALEFNAPPNLTTPCTEKKRIPDVGIPYPPSPSVSVHIVKSPAPSSLIVPSPHSAASPSITDDELMDEALIGLGK